MVLHEIGGSHSCQHTGFYTLFAHTCRTFLLASTIDVLKKRLLSNVMYTLLTPHRSIIKIKWLVDIFWWHDYLIKDAIHSYTWNDSFKLISGFRVVRMMMVVVRGWRRRKRRGRECIGGNSEEEGAQ
eukprot:15331801-Ditylum_brightwellii.AAC.1